LSCNIKSTEITDSDEGEEKKEKEQEHRPSQRTSGGKQSTNGTTKLGSSTSSYLNIFQFKITTLKNLLSIVPHLLKWAIDDGSL
jgi:hypothetical protein